MEHRDEHELARDHSRPPRDWNENQFRGCAMLLGLRERLGDDVDDPEAIGRLLDELLAKGRIAGFGVAFRGRDERVVAMKECLKRRQRDGGTYWRLIMLLDATMQDKKKLHVNFSMATAAILLDLGYEPRQVTLIMSTFLDVCFYANVLEASEQRSDVMQRVPDSCVEYVGREPRLSPRAKRNGRSIPVARAGAAGLSLTVAPDRRLVTGR